MKKNPAARACVGWPGMKLITNDDRCDTPLTSPVAFRANKPGDVTFVSVVPSLGPVDDVLFSSIALPPNFIQCSTGCLRDFILNNSPCQLFVEESRSLSVMVHDRCSPGPIIRAVPLATAGAKPSPWPTVDGSSPSALVDPSHGAASVPSCSCQIQRYGNSDASQVSSSSIPDPAKSCTSPRSTG